MYTTYKGYFNDGRFISPEPITIPDNIEVYITIIGNELLPVKTRAEKQNEALKRLSAGLSAIDDEPFDEKFDEVINKRFNIGRKLDL
ncbi:MAG: hypothetical protein FWF08_05650 [Oscillospiraceae bacterium]|nr:hypothetical protein [Oscillospiraceae bacterium]